MSTTLSFKQKIDLPEWKPLASALANTAAGNSTAFDLRNETGQANPNIFLMQALTGLTRYNTVTDGWSEMTAFTTVGGTMAVGAYCVFVPSHGISGVVGGSPTTTSFTLATLPNSATALKNQFANKGDGVGYKIRVYGNGAAGSSGLTNERFIVANSSGTAPVITVDTAFDFTPATTDHYEILAGRIYMLGAGTTAAGYWKAMDVATGTISGNLSISQLAATIGTDTEGVMLDEQYVPYNRRPGEGFLGTDTYDTNNLTTLGGSTTPLKCNICTVVANGTITGTVAGGDAGVATNQFRNFQIRIVEDTTNKTAVGQRRKITSHTAGPSPVYTLYSNWTVNPSVGAKFVIENNNDLLLWTNAATVTYSYAAGGFAADAAWATVTLSGGATQYANPGTAMGAGCSVESAFSIVPDAGKNVLQSYIYWLRGAATVTMAYLDIAAGANGVWTTIAPISQTTVTFSAGTCSAHDPHANQGRYFYVALNVTNRFLRFDMLNQEWEPWTNNQGMTQGAVLAANYLATSVFSDGSTKIPCLYQLGDTSATFFGCNITV